MAVGNEKPLAYEKIKLSRQPCTYGSSLRIRLASQPPVECRLERSCPTPDIHIPRKSSACAVVDAKFRGRIPSFGLSTKMPAHGARINSSLRAFNCKGCPKKAPNRIQLADHQNFNIVRNSSKVIKT